MRGEFISVWESTWRDIWVKLADHPHAPIDLFCELYREIEPIFIQRLDAAVELADIIDNPIQAKNEFKKIKRTDLIGEVSLIKFLEGVHPVIFDLGGDALVTRYFSLVGAFIEKFSLRYDLRQPFTLHPTLPGVFARLITELKLYTSQDAILAGMMHDFEETVRDLRNDQSSGRIKACIHRQMNLLEALAQRSPNVAGNSLGEMCNSVQTWPHATIREAMKRLYGFSSDYPGIRHAGNPNGVLRDIEMRDMVAITVVLAGFVPYLSSQVDAESIYRAGT